MSEAATQSVAQKGTLPRAVSTYAAKAYAAQSSTSGLAPATILRRNPGPQDVQIDILYCGICHSDLHQVRNEWQNAMPTVYPCVPGHEIVGRVVKTGEAVTKFKAGDIAGVGCMVDSCRSCASCRAGEEQYCDSFPTLTYNGEDKHLGGVTYGGYSENIVVDEAFVFRVSEKLNPAGTAPLLCAGVTTYSPLRHWKVGKGQKVGVVGLGGLGHMAVKFAKAFGASVTVLSTSPAKEGDARKLGADHFLNTRDAKVFKQAANRFDFILDTVAAPHDVNRYLGLLALNGSLVMVGLPEEAFQVSAFSLVRRRRSLAGSLVGGIAQTQEMLDFCGEHGITSDIELIPIQKINEAFDRTVKGDVKYRFVIDMKSLG